MQIEWNRVTWYSKLIAVIVFLMTAVLFFELGVIYGGAENAIGNLPLPINPSSVTLSTPTSSALSSTQASTTTENVPSWKIYTNQQYGFSFKYPSTWTQNCSISDSSTIGFNPINLGTETQLEAHCADIEVYAGPLSEYLFFYPDVFNQNATTSSIKNEFDADGFSRLIINGMNATKILNVYDPHADAPTLSISDVVVVQKGQNIIEFTDIGNLHKSDGIFDEIVGSVR